MARRIEKLRVELPTLLRAAEVEVHGLRQHVEADVEREWQTASAALLAVISRAGAIAEAASDP